MGIVEQIEDDYRDLDSEDWQAICEILAQRAEG
jgi:hypothetical protein